MGVCRPTVYRQEEPDVKNGLQILLHFIVPVSQEKPGAKGASKCKWTYTVISSWKQSMQNFIS